jgi:hypothetical protein
MFAINVVMENGTEWMTTGMTKAECLGNLTQELHEEYGPALFPEAVFAIQNNEQDEDMEDEFLAYCEATQIAPAFASVN